MTGEGFRNPVIAGFHPDPSVCRVGDQYLLVVSSFTYVPGVPIFRSRNLVDWEQIGNVLDRPAQLDVTSSVWASGGVYAPTIRHHDGRYWMITTVNGGTLANSFVTATDPAGPWSDPVPVDVLGIDPDLAWDADGSCWMHLSTGMGGIVRCRIDDITGEVLEGPEPTWSGSGLQYPEAPHLVERDGTWYLLIAEGGTERGHAVSIARGPSPVGPWEGCPANPVLSHRSTDHPIQSTGHADLVEATDGSWWAVLLGTRPRGVTPGFHVLGRETFLAPVTWVDGWPVFGGVELEATSRPPGPAGVRCAGGRDDFDGGTLHPRWVGVRRSPEAVASLTTRPGWLTLAGGTATLDAQEPVFVGRRQQHHRTQVRALVDPMTSDEAGIAIRMDEASHYEVAVAGDRLIVRACAGPFQQVVADQSHPRQPTVLTVSTGPHVHGPDTVTLGYEDDEGQGYELASLDGRYLSTEVTGGFLGRMIGMYAVGGDAAFDWFAYDDDEAGR